MVTQKDIAAACGVSTATVSKALNDLPDISEEMKRFICETAARMGYKKSVPTITKPCSHMIGLLVTEDAETFFHHNLILEIRQTLMEEGYDLVMLSPVCGDIDDMEGRIIADIAKSQQAGEEKESIPLEPDSFPAAGRYRKQAAAGFGGRIAGQAVAQAAGRSSSQPARRPGFLSRARLMGLDGVILISGASESSLYNSTNLVETGDHIEESSYTGDFQQSRALRSFQQNCAPGNFQQNHALSDLQQSRALRDLILSEIPVVSVDCSYGLCGSVVPAYEEGIRTLLSTACRMGHSRISLIYGNGNAGTIMKNEFLRMCAELHLNVPVNYMIRVRAESMQDAYEAVTAALQGARWIHPTCYLFGDDFLLEGGCAALRSRGCRIPEDISVASISCEYMSNSLEGMVHALTSWRIRPALIAEEAVRMLLSEIHFPGKTSRQTRKISGHTQLGETISSIWTPGGMYRAPGQTV